MVGRRNKKGMYNCSKLGRHCERRQKKRRWCWVHCVLPELSVCLCVFTPPTWLLLSSNFRWTETERPGNLRLQHAHTVCFDSYTSGHNFHKLIWFKPLHNEICQELLTCCSNEKYCPIEGSDYVMFSHLNNSLLKPEFEVFKAVKTCADVMQPEWNTRLHFPHTVSQSLTLFSRLLVFHLGWWKDLAMLQLFRFSLWKSAELSFISHKTLTLKRTAPIKLFHWNRWAEQHCQLTFQ